MKKTDKWKRGFPYVGNKSVIAQQLLDQMPSGKRFVDVFGGGGSMSLFAWDSMKYDEIVWNDKRSYIKEAFEKLTTGKVDLFKYVNLTRSEFEDWKLKPWNWEKFIVLDCWSFSNNLKSYLWGTKIEDKKLSVTDTIFNGTPNKYYPDLHKMPGTNIYEIYNNYHKWRNEKIKWFKDGYLETKSGQQLQQLQRLQQLQQLQQLQRLQQLQQLERLQKLNNQFDHLNLISKDYRELNLLPDDVVYLDPPYQNTSEQYDGFNHDAFINWYKSLPQENIFISGYEQLPGTDILCSLGKRSMVSTKKTWESQELLMKVIK